MFLFVDEKAPEKGVSSEEMRFPTLERMLAVSITCTKLIYLC
jgi:hypothetical protein